MSAHRERQVRRQRPRCRRPGQDPLAGLEFEADRERRVLAIAVGVVQSCLGVAQRCLATPAVREHPEPLVDEALVPEGLERPHDALHVGQVERLVVVVEVDPASLAGDVLAPVVGVLEHARPAGLVELVDAERGDLRMAGDAELLFGLDLGRQTVAVPAEPALDAPAAHRLVARHRVLDEAGQQVAVVRQSVGERRAVVEHELVGAVRPGVTLIDRALERGVLAPDREDVVFEGGKFGFGSTAGYGTPRCYRRGSWPPMAVQRSGSFWPDRSGP